MLSVIIVTHNSEQVIDRCLECLERQSVTVDQIIIVDSGSDNLSYLDGYKKKTGYEIFHRENIGYAAGNNFGLQHLKSGVQHVLLINPDTFLEPGTIKSCQLILSAKPEVAIVTGRLKGYDLESHQPSGLLDSTGIFRTWYGRWYDRGQGCTDGDNFTTEMEPKAVCGAFMFCRSNALQQNLPELFDESFFMYKEDIDLCLRLRKQGWKLLYSPKVVAFHARGWVKDRKQVSYQHKCLSSKNEIRLNWKHRSPYLLWAFSKYLLVRVLRV